MKTRFFRVFTLLAVAVMCVSICVSCAAPSQKAEETLKTILESFKSGDVNAINGYYPEGALTPVWGDEELAVVVAKSAKNMTYTIENVEEASGKLVKFKVVFTSVDTVSVTEKYIQNVTEMISDTDYKNNANNITEVEFRQKMFAEMENVLDSTDLNMAEKTATIEMTKERGRWKISDTDLSLPKLLYGNLAGIVNSLI